MGELLLIALGAALVNNLALAELLGAGALLRAPRGIDAAAALGLATGATLLVATPLTALIERDLLTALALPQLRLIAFLVTTAIAGWSVLTLLRRFAPRLHARLPPRLALLNGAILGVALQGAASSRSLSATLFYALGVALGFILALVVFAGLRERLLQADVPLAFRGPPILFVTAGLLSLAFLAFAGFARL